MNIKEILKGNIMFISLFLLMIIVVIVIGIKIQKNQYNEPPLSTLTAISSHFDTILGWFAPKLHFNYSFVHHLAI